MKRWLPACLVWMSACVPTTENYSSKPVLTCTPEAVTPCVCASGRAGTQACDARGSSLLLCDCLSLAVTPTSAVVTVGTTVVVTAAVQDDDSAAGAELTLLESEGAAFESGAFIGDAPGTYHVVARSRSRPDRSAIAEITVLPELETPRLSVTAQVLVAGSEEVEARVTNPAPSATYVWTLTNATLTTQPSGDSVRFIPGGVGVTTMTVNVTNTAGQSAAPGVLSLPVVDSIAASLSLKIVAPPRVTTSRDDIEVSVSPALSGLSFSWSVDQGTITALSHDSSRAIVHTPTEAGTVSITVFASDAALGKSKPATKSMQVVLSGTLELVHGSAGSPSGSNLGGSGRGGNTDGVGDNARLSAPRELVADGTGRAYFINSAPGALGFLELYGQPVGRRGGRSIRYVESDGSVTTASFPADFLAAGAAPLPIQRLLMASDGAGTVYVLNVTSCVVMKSVLGAAAIAHLDAGQLCADQFAARYPTRMAADAAGTLYLWVPVDPATPTGGGRFYQWTASGISALNSLDTPVCLDGGAGSARIGDVGGFTAGPDGALYWIERGTRPRLRSLSADHTAVSTLLGPACNDNVTVSLLQPFRALVRVDNNTFIASGSSEDPIEPVAPASVVRLTLSPPSVVTIAGDAIATGDSDAPPTRFSAPTSLAVSGADLWVADQVTHRIRRVLNGAQASAVGVVQALAGKARDERASSVSDGILGFPIAMTSDARGVAYLAEVDFNAQQNPVNCLLRKVNSDSTAESVLSGSCTTRDGPRAFASFQGTADAFKAMAVSAAGDLLWVENNSIRRLTSSGVVGLVAGDYPNQSQSDFSYATGFSSSVRFRSPRGMVSDKLGNLYIADSGNHMIRLLLPSGQVVDLVGEAPIQAAGDTVPGRPETNGPAEVASFHTPAVLALDQVNGFLYIDDAGHDAIRRLTLTGDPAVKTVVGGAAVECGFSPNNVKAMTVDRDGSLIVVDTRSEGNSYTCVKRIRAAGSGACAVTNLAGDCSAHGVRLGLNAHTSGTVGLGLTPERDLWLLDATERALLVLRR